MKRAPLALALVLASLVARAADTQAETPPALVTTVGCIGITVSDVDRSADFYVRVLDFRRDVEIEVAGEPYERLAGIFGVRMRTVRVRLGEECLDLTEYVAPRGRPAPADSRSNDRWFQHVAIVVADMDRAYQRLRAARAEHVSSGPQRLPDWNPKAGGIRAFYFRDPDRHVLELIQFPEGKGDPRWHTARASKQAGDLVHWQTEVTVADLEGAARALRRAGAPLLSATAVAAGTGG